MPDADIPFSSAPISGDASGSIPEPFSPPSASKFGLDVPRSIFDDFLREREFKERAAAQPQEQTATAAPLSSPGGSSSSSLEDGGPIAPRIDEMLKHFEEAEKSAEEQRQSVRERDRREGEAAAAEIRGHAAIEDAFRIGGEKANLVSSQLKASREIQAGIEQEERRRNSGMSL
ncbi:hypothetical protein G6L68_25315 [Agrobacterium fabrum]|uniref:hypothetical protein n=1 Tax=Agrobacterium fabrum TaxID=1176649 RepID=UPI000EF579CD|nr:hypothetical protein [Agrobacterium fabrum]AYM66208.1 hypothetical protein At12D13_50560 [Agrobacterium fabrum]NTE63954.1 hypothetical protein [Agrobacterium fabrum]